MSILYETVLGRMGSRFSLNLRPTKNELKTSFLGRFYDAPLNISIGIKSNGITRILPFSSKYQHFDKIEQEVTMTSITYLCKDALMGIEAEIKFIAPFYPQNTEISTLPVFYIEANIRGSERIKLSGDSIYQQYENSCSGEFFIEINEEKTRTIGNTLLWENNAKIEKEIAQVKSLYRTTGADFSSKVLLGEMGININGGHASLTKVYKEFNRPCVCECVLGAYSMDDVLRVYGSNHKFLYTQNYNNISEVFDYAIKNKSEIMCKNNFFEQSIHSSSLGKTGLNLLSSAFQSYLSNTWWTFGQEGEWFSVWEGNCAYHSTIDVEYNVSIFYLMLWPKLLKMQLKAWSRAIKPEGFMPHDLGKFLVVEEMQYSHDMEVEESCNFILLCLGYLKYTNDIDFIKEIYPQIKTLVYFIKNADTTGNGFANVGTKNTFDDAGPAVQISKEQTYLGIKAMCSYLSVLEFIDKLNDEEIKALCTDQITKINKTLEEKAWIGDHFAVCIDSNSVGVKHAWTNEELSGEIQGWDAYSIYPTNGLLYPLLCGIKFPFDIKKLRMDIKNATEKSQGRYGCRHSSSDETPHVWISQNIWRDLIAAYLGIDTIDMIEKYWDYQLYENSIGVGGCFVENYPSAALYYYPRGIALIGVFYAMAGINIDLSTNSITAKPIRTGKFPLLSVADWDNMTIDYVISDLVEGQLTTKIERNDKNDK